MNPTTTTTRVLIVAKTHQGSRACIGAITVDGRSIRLVAADAADNEHAGTEYELGEVWEVQSAPAQAVTPPHVENVIVYAKRRLRTFDGVVPFVERHMPPVCGGPDALYEGLVQHSTRGQLFISERSGVPSFSTGFWRPDRDLVRDDTSHRLHYRYTADDGDRTLTFVGYQDPPAVIPAGTLVRVSLAHWWRPADHPDDELRCYVQLSGWFDEPASGNGRAPAPEPARRPATPDGPRPTIDEARGTLRSVFGFDGFLPAQEEVILSVLAGRDTLAVMPTGGGKSLCYQLPALLFPGLTVVVSPLIALMQDQVDQLRAYDIPAAFLNSSQTYAEQTQVMERARRGGLKLLYMAPESLLRPETLVLLDRCRVDCLTIDEAHCISQWGHDFRPEYRQLVGVRQRLPNATLLAVTATATERVRADIQQSLEMPGAAEFVASFDRTNLNLVVRPKTSGFDQLVEFLRAHPGESGIVYCLARKTVDQTTDALRQLGFSALPYHAGLDDATRRANQRAFVRDDAAIIVATIAFGMGIHKSNVRFVVHYNLPRDVESYYQEIGRAGRDGLPADCLLLFSQTDVQTLRFMNQEHKDQDRRVEAEVRLQAMLRYAQATTCRRVTLLPYFGEAFEPPCGRCDNCAAVEGPTEDLTVPAQKFLSCVVRTGQRFGITHTVDILRGSHAQDVVSRGHDKLPTHGIGREYSKSQWQYLAHEFITRGLLNQDPVHRGLSLTREGRAVLKGQSFHGVLHETTPSAVGLAEAPAHDLILFEQLRDVRRMLADEEGVPAYVIMHDRSLIEMATYFPQSEETIGGIYGVGRRKAEKYGPAFVAVITAFCARHGLQETFRPTHVTDPAIRAPRARTRQVAQVFQDGSSVQESAEALGITTITVLDHLRRYTQHGGKLDAARLLAEVPISREEHAAAFDAFRDLGTFALAPVFDALEQRVTYEDLHRLRLYYELTADEANSSHEGS